MASFNAIGHILILAIATVAPSYAIPLQTDGSQVSSKDSCAIKSAGFTPFEIGPHEKRTSDGGVEIYTREDHTGLYERTLGENSGPDSITPDFKVDRTGGSQHPVQIPTTPRKAISPAVLPIGRASQKQAKPPVQRRPTMAFPKLPKGPSYATEETKNRQERLKGKSRNGPFSVSDIFVNPAVSGTNPFRAAQHHLPAVQGDSPHRPSGSNMDTHEGGNEPSQENPGQVGNPTPLRSKSKHEKLLENVNQRSERAKAPERRSFVQRGYKTLPERDYAEYVAFP